MIMTGGLAILHIAAPSKVWTILFFVLVIVQVLAYFWMKQLSNYLQLVRERRSTWNQVGDHLEERFTLINDSPFPALWVEVRDHSNMPGYQASQVTGLSGSSSNYWHSSGVCRRRGVFQLGPVQANTSDPFGLFLVEQVYPNTIDMVIFPPVVPLPEINIDTRGNFGDEETHSYSLARIQAAASVRPYRSGDSWNRIHWPTTARRNEFYVRQMERASSGNWWLLLDLDLNIHPHHEAPDSTLEKTIIVAASLTDQGLNKHQAVGLLTAGPESIWLLPRASPDQRWAIFKALAEVQGGTLSLNDLLLRSRSMLERQASLIIITATTTLDWLPSLLLLKRQGVIPTIIFIAKFETQSQIESAHHLLNAQGVTTYVLDETAIVVPEMDLEKDTWEWRILGTGKAVAVNKPQGAWEKV